jgi:hypothetical protein
MAITELRLQEHIEAVRNTVADSIVSVIAQCKKNNSA